MHVLSQIFIILLLISFNTINANEITNKKKIIYLSPDISIPFWQIMAKGIKTTSNSLGYEFEAYNSNNSAKKELELTVKAIKENVSGIIVSPSNSSACVTILKLAEKAGIPVVISDIGTDSGKYVSYISSNNKDGAYNIGKILTKRMLHKKWNNGKVGIIAIPQKRLNGQRRTAGFMKALNEENIKGANIMQMVKWTNKETYSFTKQFILDYPDLRAIWLQTSNLYKGALEAINDMGKEKELLLIAFDAEPEFLNLIPQGKIIASGMQQPYLMGVKSVEALNSHLEGNNVEKNIQVPILTVTTENIDKKLSIINQNVLGIE